MNIEQDLHRALARKPAPPDLADRVMGKIEAERSPAGGWTGRHVRWLAAAAAVVLLAGGGARYYEEQRQAAEAERVKHEIRTALQITTEVLSLAQMRIQESGNRR
jgi:hypothetical protein